MSSTWFTAGLCLRGFAVKLRSLEPSQSKASQMCKRRYPQPWNVEAESYFSGKYTEEEFLTYLLTPMLRTLPLSTSSSSFCQVGYGFAVSSSSTTLSEPFLNAIGHLHQKPRDYKVASSTILKDTGLLTSYSHQHGRSILQFTRWVRFPLAYKGLRCAECFREVIIDNVYLQWRRHIHGMHWGTGRVDNGEAKVPREVKYTWIQRLI